MKPTRIANEKELNQISILRFRKLVTDAVYKNITLDIIAPLNGYEIIMFIETDYVNWKRVKTIKQVEKIIAENNLNIVSVKYNGFAKKFDVIVEERE